MCKNIKFIVISSLLLMLLCMETFGVDITYSANVLDKISLKSENARIYKVENRKFAKKDARDILDSIGAEMPLSSEKITENMIIFKSGNDTLFFDNEKTSFHYYDDSIVELTGDDTTDTLKLKADKIKENIEKKFNLDLMFVNNEYDWIMTREGKEVMTHISYRYVRVLDSHLVLGNVNHLVITLGSEGKVKSLLFTNPSIKKMKELKKKVKKSASLKRLEKKLETSSDFIIVDPIEGTLTVTDFVPEQVVDSYITEDRAGVKVLAPNLTFYGLLTYSNGKNFENHVNLPMDGEVVSDLEDDDFDHLPDKPDKF